MAINLSFSTGRLTVLGWRDVQTSASAYAALERQLPVILTEPVLRHLPLDLRHGGEDFDPHAWKQVFTARNTVGAVITAADETPIGFVIIREENEAGSARQVWIGYLLAEHAWGQGYATELAQGVVDMLRQGGEMEILAGVAVGNTASMRVLQKIGFSADPDTSDDLLTVFRLPNA